MELGPHGLGACHVACVVYPHHLCTSAQQYQVHSNLAFVFTVPYLQFLMPHFSKKKPKNKNLLLFSTLGEEIVNSFIMK